MNMENIKEKVKKIKVNKVLIGAVMLGLIASIVVYFLMLDTQKKALTAYEKGVIYVATKNIPEGTVIRENNYSQFFVQKELDKTLIPKSAIIEPEQLTSLITSNQIDEGTLITQGMFESVNEITKGMRNPVIAGFHVEDLYQVVGGTLRVGDRINIYNVNEEGVAEAIWSNVYVQEVFDNTGAKIESSDNAKSAQRINVYMDNMDIEKFYSDLAEGTLRVVKVCD